MGAEVGFLFACHGLAYSLRHRFNQPYCITSVRRISLTVNKHQDG
jgi:hypothetical protein